MSGPPDRPWFRDRTSLRLFSIEHGLTVESASAGAAAGPRVGAFVLPPFQRPFVWSEAQADRLIRSIWEGMPFGGNVNAAIDRAIADTPHRAFSDAYVTAHILRHMLQQVGLEQLIQWTLEPGLLPRCSIGDWRGKRWPEVDESFLYWILGKDFSEDIRFTVKHELERRKKEAAAQRAAEQAAPKITIERVGGPDDLAEARG